MSDRAEFEKRNPVPESAVWCEKKQGYYWRNYPTVAHLFNDKWEAWQEAVDYVRAQGGEWLIQMRGEYLTTRGVWERPDHRGYTNDISEAGRYSEDEAKEAEQMMPEKCKAVRLPTARAQGGQGAEAVAEFCKSHHYVRQNHISWLVDIDDLPDYSLLYTQPQPTQPAGVGWIKCSERLPTEADADWDDDVIVFDSEGDMAVTHYGVVEQCGQPGGAITHWMPTGLKRPQPPKEGE